MRGERRAGCNKRGSGRGRRAVELEAGHGRLRVLGYLACLAPAQGTRYSERCSVLPRGRLRATWAWESLVFGIAGGMTLAPGVTCEALLFGMRQDGPIVDTAISSNGGRDLELRQARARCPHRVHCWWCGAARSHSGSGSCSAQAQANMAVESGPPSVPAPVPVPVPVQCSAIFWVVWGPSRGVRLASQPTSLMKSLLRLGASQHLHLHHASITLSRALAGAIALMPLSTPYIHTYRVERMIGPVVNTLPALHPNG